MQIDKVNKWCPKCQQYLSRDEFYRNVAQSDGLAPYCKLCWREFCRVRHARLRVGLPDKRRSHLLGILDGDGWITIDPRKYTPYYTIGFVSASSAFLERVAQEISAALDVSAARVNKLNTAFSLRYGKRSAVLISKWLHRDLPGLARKRIPV